MYTERSGQAEANYFRSLYSEEMDVKEARPPLLRYAILSQARTGSELVAAYLRQQGIGFPLEYFHENRMPQLAVRWGCLEADGNVRLDRYGRELHRHRTVSNGIFGIKIGVPQLGPITGGNPETATVLLRGMDKVLLMRRYDTLRQAVSLMRAVSTGQWHVIPGDDHARVTASDMSVLAPRITHCWALVLSQDRDMTRLEATLAPDRVRTVWYEDLQDPKSMGMIADWLCTGIGVPAQPPKRKFPLPKRGDTQEADAIVKAYLEYNGLTG
ncbi:MAG TPA: Stf0 family sulfotransferase [Stellaceae bacterium]|nr:Stf0 family sulfotransferase [Stellaceae bacterium]